MFLRIEFSCILQQLSLDERCGLPFIESHKAAKVFDTEHFTEIKNLHPLLRLPSQAPSQYLSVFWYNCQIFPSPSQPNEDPVDAPSGQENSVDIPVLMGGALPYTGMISILNENYEEALKSGTAAGSATAFSEGLASLEMYEKMLKQITE